LQCIFKIEHAAGSLRTLKLLVAGSAFAHSFATQAHEGAPGKQHDTERQLCVPTLVGLELSKHAAMQMTPLTNGLALVVALLPAMQAVFRRALLLVRQGIFSLS